MLCNGFIFLLLQFACYCTTYPAFYPIRMFLTQIECKQITIKRFAMQIIRRQTALTSSVCTCYYCKFRTCFHSYLFNR